MTYKPSGYTSVSPYLIVRDAEATLKFVQDVFRAEQLRIIRRKSGEVQHAEARLDDTVIMMGEMPNGPEAHVHVYVEDPASVFARAINAGSIVVQALELKDDGDRRGGVKDANGTTWWDLARRKHHKVRLTQKLTACSPASRRYTSGTHSSKLARRLAQIRRAFLCPQVHTGSDR